VRVAALSCFAIGLTSTFVVAFADVYTLHSPGIGNSMSATAK